MWTRHLRTSAGDAFLSVDSGTDIEHIFCGQWLADLANFSAFVFQRLPDVNWAGFYLFDGQKLILGPFCGKPACTEIKVGRGVCGTAFAEKRSLLVKDVHEFTGHIACDSASRSELVIPLAKGGVAFGVFDLDSPSLARFTEKDRVQVEQWLELLIAKLPERISGRPWV
ncbi:MAG: GAF domain-containing protein [Bdellovibrionota bacterium]